MFVFCKLHGEINQEMYERLSSAVDRATEKAKLEKCFLMVHINSIGGNDDWAIEMGFLLYSCREKNIETYAVGFEKVYSAALLVYLSCTFRLAYKKTKFLIHRAIKAKNEEMWRFLIGECGMFEFFSEILGIPLFEIYDMANRNTYLSHNEAFQKKIINFPWDVKSERPRLLIH